MGKFMSRQEERESGKMHFGTGTFEAVVVGLRLACRVKTSGEMQ